MPCSASAHRRLLRRSLLAALLLAASAPAWAIYKIVGPDGQVTFSDMPPSNPGKDKVQPLSVSGQSQPDTRRLPAALREATRKYPVTLYVTHDCPACDAGRKLLQERGVPFSERTVNTPADIEAYKKLVGDDLRMPRLALGSTRLSAGFSAESWNNALDAAGYPSKNELPKGYAQPAAQPLAPPKVEAPKASEPAGSALPAVPVKPPPNPKAPPGFQF